MPLQAKVDVRQRLIEAALELFYAEGLRAVSVDRVVEQARTTKITFYRHFRSKDDLVVEYLQHCAAQEREAISAAITDASSDPDGALERVAELLGGMACLPGFRGCPFINAAAEYTDPAHRVRVAVNEHRAWCLSAFESVVEHLEPARRGTAARALMLLRDGAMVGGYLDHAEVATAFHRGGRAIVFGT